MQLEEHQLQIPFVYGVSYNPWQHFFPAGTQGSSERFYAKNTPRTAFGYHRLAAPLEESSTAREILGGRTKHSASLVP